MYCDFHTHSFENCDSTSKKCISFYDQVSFENFLTSNVKCNDKTKIAIGVHPWYLDEEFFKYIKSLFSEDKSTEKSIKNIVSCVGEIGVDFAVKKYDLAFQLEAFERQLDFAISHNLPVIIHNVKGFHNLVQNIKKLKNVKSCVFHGYSGTYEEAMYFLRHNVNAFFSFGKNLLNNSKKTLDCFKNLPDEKIGLETDNEITQAIKIEAVYKKAFELKKIKNQENINNFMVQIEHNFDSIFT